MPGHTEAKRITPETPLGAVGRGAAAGFAATLLLSGLVRLMPGMGEQASNNKGDKKQESQPPPPPDPFDQAQVRAWQKQAQSPAAYQQREQQRGQDDQGARVARVTPAGALSQAQGPGPEGAAQQFVLKLGSGLLSRDLSPYAKPAGEALHFVYGSSWGVLYGIVQATMRQPPLLAGLVHGMVVWAVGPAGLVPAMKLMRPLTKQQPQQLAMMIAGHLLYGVTVAQVFAWLEREVSHD